MNAATERALRSVPSAQWAAWTQERDTALQAAAGLSGNAVNPVARNAWFDYLGVTKGAGIKLDLLTSRIEKAATFAFIQGWGGGKQPSLLANSTAQHVRIPGNMKAHAVALLPTSTHKAAVAWRSPARMNGIAAGSRTRDSGTKTLSAGPLSVVVGRPSDQAGRVNTVSTPV